MLSSAPFQVDIPVINENFSDFNPTIAGYSQCTPNHLSPVTVRADFEIHYIVSGKGIFNINNKTYSLKAGNVFIIPPHTKHFYKADENDPWYYIWIGFGGKLANKFLSMDSVYEFNEPELFFNIRDSANIQQYRTEYLYAQLLLIYRHLAPLRPYEISYAHIIKHQICATYMTHINVNMLADYCNIHRNYATKIFKREFGMTISQFITQYRMQKAMEFLSQGYSVEIAANYVGYDEYSNFSRKFKNFFGVPPSKYKNITRPVYSNTETYIPSKTGMNPFLK